MKTKNLVIAQTVLFAAAVLAGFILRGDLAEGPRMIHRYVGMLATLVAVATAIMSLKQTTTMEKVLPWVVVILGAVAGYAGNSLKTADSYSSMFDLMRGTGFLALVVSAVIWGMMSKKKVEVA
jgi:hypothetical protein